VLFTGHLADNISAAWANEYTTRKIANKAL
jgi:hypothetical protein